MILPRSNTLIMICSVTIQSQRRFECLIDSIDQKHLRYLKPRHRFRKSVRIHVLDYMQIFLTSIEFRKQPTKLMSTFSLILQLLLYISSILILLILVA
jgi:hypothetical protein